MFSLYFHTHYDFTHYLYLFDHHLNRFFRFYQHRYKSTISDTVGSKMLAVLLDSCYSDSEAFTLSENYTYNFSDIEICSIVDTIK